MEIHMPSWKKEMYCVYVCFVLFPYLVLLCH